MAKEKFQLVSERFLGNVNPTLAKKWERLAARQQKLNAQFEKLKQDVGAFEEKLAEQLPEDDATVAHEGFRLEPDGRLFQVLCKCFECQAKVQRMNVIETVEGMIKAGLIRQGEEAATRAHAYQIENARRQEEQNRQLLN